MSAAHIQLVATGRQAAGLAKASRGRTMGCRHRRLGLRPARGLAACEYLEPVTGRHVFMSTRQRLRRLARSFHFPWHPEVLYGPLLLGPDYSEVVGDEPNWAPGYQKSSREFAVTQTYGGARFPCMAAATRTTAPMMGNGPDRCNSVMHVAAPLVETRSCFLQPSGSVIRGKVPHPGPHERPARPEQVTARMRRPGIRPPLPGRIGPVSPQPRSAGSRIGQGVMEAAARLVAE